MANDNLQNPSEQEASERQELLKSYLRRLNSGEDLETIRAEFVKNFKDVSINEIVGAEQNLIKEGVPFQKVQKLCDIHSALFHGKTQEEVLKAEQEAIQKLQQTAGSGTVSENDAAKTPATDEQRETVRKSTMANLKARRASKMASLPEGHPARQLMAENRALEKVLDEAEMALEAFGEKGSKDSPLREGAGKLGVETDAAAKTNNPDTGMAEDVQILKKSLLPLLKIRALYSRKEELLMPRLEEYGITGPTVVMWGADDEIKADIRKVLHSLSDETAPGLLGQAGDVLRRMREMIYKEDNILYPLAVENLTEEQWYEVYRDLPEMGEAFLPENQKKKWPEAEKWMEEQKKKNRKDALANGKIHLDGGELTVKQLNAILKLLPVDVTFADEEEINRYFLNEGHVFARPQSALGRKLYSCHPQQILPMVKQMIADFKAHKRDHLDRWINRPGNPVKISYHAVYDEDGSYLGTLEIVQQFGDVLEKLRAD